MSASSRAPPSATRTYSRPSDRAIDLAIDGLPTPGGPTKSRIGPLAIARDSASRLSAMWRLARFFDPLRQFLGRQLAHGQELEHAILYILEPVMVVVEHVFGVREIEL